MRSAWTKVRVTGPLAPYAPRFAQELLARGYTDLSTADQLRLMAHASRWLDEHGLGAVVLDDEHWHAYRKARRQEGYTRRLTPKALRPLREFLCREGRALPPAPAVPAGAESELVARYQAYLTHERALTQQVVIVWAKAAKLFMAQHPGLAVGELDVGSAEVAAFCVRELPCRGNSSAKHLASALRSFLGFLYLEAIIDAPLAHAVPPVAHRSGTSVPQGLSPANVEALVASCDRRRSVGRRDQAILLLLARLGLRAREVAELRLDDIDWRAGEVVVRGKGRRQDLLPLPSDVGAAIVAYLHRGRPKADIRTIFLRAIAPAEPLSPGGITAVVYAACDRAGIPRAGAHRLRHTLATQTLRAGGSLDEVGELLRHAAVSTTGIYAKVDATALASLVLPWPGERS
jgi:site-specific recombinase XerD